jgi:hypothetical protein
MPTSVKPFSHMLIIICIGHISHAVDQKICQKVWNPLKSFIANLAVVTRVYINLLVSSANPILTGKIADNIPSEQGDSNLETGRMCSSVACEWPDSYSQSLSSILHGSPRRIQYCRAIYVLAVCPVTALPPISGEGSRSDISWLSCSPIALKRCSLEAPRVYSVGCAQL